jgi:hypothetical protein
VLCRSAELPTGRCWTFQPKIDGFRLRVDTTNGYRTVSGRGHNFAGRLPDARRTAART